MFLHGKRSIENKSLTFLNYLSIRANVIFICVISFSWASMILCASFFTSGSFKWAFLLTIIAME